jgi:transposase
VLQYHFTWKTLSVIAGITFWNFYFRLFPGAIRSPQIIAFLTHLLRHIPGKLLIVWDGLPARGRGGTAEIVAWARGLGKPVCQVWPDVVDFSGLRRGT